MSPRLQGIKYTLPQVSDATEVIRDALVELDAEFSTVLPTAGVIGMITITIVEDAARAVEIAFEILKAAKKADFIDVEKRIMNKLPQAAENALLNEENKRLNNTIALLTEKLEKAGIHRSQKGVLPDECTDACRWHGLSATTHAFHCPNHPNNAEE